MNLDYIDYNTSFYFFWSKHLLLLLLVASHLFSPLCNPPFSKHTKHTPATDESWVGLDASNEEAMCLSRCHRWDPLRRRPAWAPGWRLRTTVRSSGSWSAEVFFFVWRGVGDNWGFLVFFKSFLICRHMFRIFICIHLRIAKVQQLKVPSMIKWSV